MEIWHFEKWIFLFKGKCNFKFTTSLDQFAYYFSYRKMLFPVYICFLVWVCIGRNLVLSLKMLNANLRKHQAISSIQNRNRKHFIVLKLYEKGRSEKHFYKKYLRLRIFKRFESVKNLVVAVVFKKILIWFRQVWLKNLKYPLSTCTSWI